jgi:hypothetical protein
VPDIRNAEHEYWLAMRAAYQRYTSVSATLDLLTSQLLSAACCSDERRRIERAASEQRTAFENYIEARIQYFEFQFDRRRAGIESFQRPHSSRISAIPGEEKSARPSWAGFADSRRARQAAVLVLVCAATFSLVDLVRERRHLCDSDAVRNEIRAMLSQTGDGLQALTRKIDALIATRQFTLRESAAATAAPGSQQRVTVARSAVTPYGAAQKQGKIPANRNDQVHQVLKFGEPSYYAFRLPLSRRFERVGPLRLSLRMVNPNKKYFDLCIMADNLRLRHRKLFEPVRINLSDPSRRVDLIVNRIDKKYVRGYLTVRKTERSELAASQVPQRRAGGS